MAEASAASSAPPPVATELTWSQVWQLPVLLLGAGLFVIGLWMVAPQKQPHNFPGALDTVTFYLESSQPELEKAETKLQAIQPYLEQAATSEDAARFYQYFADLNYLQSNRAGFAPVATEQSAKTNQKIISYYRKAEELDRSITGRSLHRYAQTLVSLGQDDEALALLDKMQGEPPSRHYELVKLLISRHRGREKVDLDALTTLVERFKSEVNQEQDSAQRRVERIWVTGLEADMKLAAGDPDSTIRLLVMERLPRLQKSNSENKDLAPLYIKLARAYHDIAAFDDAKRNYQRAQSLLRSDSDPLNAYILVGLGQLELSRSGDISVPKALEYFALAEREFPSSAVHIDALIGRGDCEARSEDMEAESASHFRQAVVELIDRTSPRDLRRGALTDTVDSHMARAVDRRNYDRALELLELLVPLYGDKLPANQVLRFAITHERIATQRAESADQIQANLESGKPNATVEARELAYQQAVIHHELAGNYYLDHAHLVTIADDKAHGESLWHAAASYDSAQLWSKAIAVYAEFVKTRSTDPMRVRAAAQLGKAYLADSQYNPAIEQFLQLASDHPHSPETYDILVPLAQAYIAIDDFSAARRGLEQIVTDHPSITPQSPEYQYALIELGKLLYRLGEQDSDFYVPAIERLTEAVERYGDAGQGPTLRFLLADAYRKSIKAIDEMLIDRPAKDTQLELQRQRDDRLAEAQKLYNQVVNELEARPQVTITPMQQLYRRNAYFYQADCAFDRRQYEPAISLYDIAARRFEDHPASLIALVQIVNAHCELGQFQEARVANEQARWQLQRIPDESFEDPDLPLTRRHWEDWLRWTSDLEVFGRKASAQ